MAKLNETEEYGLKVLAEMAGGDFAKEMRSIAESDEFCSEMARSALRYSFAEAWGREGSFDRKSKSIAIVSALIGMRATHELKNHVRIGLKNGLTVSDFESILIQLQPYVGIPTAVYSMVEVWNTLREAGQNLQGKTGVERGLL